MLPRKDYTPNSFNRTKPQWPSKYKTCLYNQIQCTILMHDIHDRNCPRHVWISLWAQQNLWKLRISAFYTSVPHIHQPRSYTSSSSLFSQGIQAKLDISITRWINASINGKGTEKSMLTVYLETTKIHTHKRTHDIWNMKNWKTFLHKKIEETFHFGQHKIVFY